MPRITVPRDSSLARATAVTPPKPMASASAAATKRRVRSSRTCARTLNFRIKPVSAPGINASIKHSGLKLFYLFCDSRLAAQISEMNERKEAMEVSGHLVSHVV
jgi:hypothetical protein